MIDLIMTACAAASIFSAAPEPEISFDIWDWTPPCQDIRKFEAWTADLASIGFTRVEISVPWNLLEKEPGEYDLTWLDERIGACEKVGLGMRLRINSYYMGATPDWYKGARWIDAKGKDANNQGLPSILDDEFWAHYGPLCARIAERCKGKDILLNAFIGIHAELKFADWWSYDAPLMAAWRETIRAPRPKWLLDVAGDVPLPETPSIPNPTQGLPDTSPESRAFIAFREWCWREAMRRFESAVQEGDPAARISAPLGESYRRESASMSNLDYWGLSRGAQQVVHSYDFWMHSQEPAWLAGASVAAFRGITGMPVCFEFDSTKGMLNVGFNIPSILAIAQDAARGGAGMKSANNSYQDILPSSQPALQEMIRVWRDAWRPAPPSPPAETVLLFLSKWANYDYRESTEWLHDAQFGVYKILRDSGIPLRIICEDNLMEDLSGYYAIYMAFSPRALMPESAKAALDALTIPVVEDMPYVPPLYNGDASLKAEGLEGNVTLTAPSCPVGPVDLCSAGADYTFALTLGDMKLAAHRPGHVLLGYPAGLLYLRGEHPAVHQGMVLWALQQAMAEQ